MRAQKTNTTIYGRYLIRLHRHNVAKDVFEQVKQARHLVNILLILLQQAYSKTNGKAKLLKGQDLYRLLRDIDSKQVREYKKAIARYTDLIDLLNKAKTIASYTNSQWLRSICDYVYRIMVQYIKRKTRRPRPKKIDDYLSFTIGCISRGVFRTVKNVDDNLHSCFKIVLPFKDQNTLNTKHWPSLTIKLPKPIDKVVKEVRIGAKTNEYVYVEVIYEKAHVLASNQNTSRIGYVAAIDFGIRNLIALVSNNPNVQSLIIKSGDILHRALVIRKTIADLERTIAKYKAKTYDDKSYIVRRIKTRLHRWLNRFIDHIFHAIAKQIIITLHKTHHKILVYGKNITELKHEINIGRDNNAKAYSLPHRRLTELLKYYGQLYGIDVIGIDESYTSKSHPLLPLQTKNQKTKNQTYIKQVSNNQTSKSSKLVNLNINIPSIRSLFAKFGKANKKVLAHADLVGAYNILRKFLGKTKLFDNLKLVLRKLCTYRTFSAKYFCNYALVQGRPMLLVDPGHGNTWASHNSK